MFTYNLIRESWIPCVFADDTKKNCSLSEVLLSAHNIREIWDPSPLVTLALHRFLLSITHRLFGPKNLDAWIKVWSRGALRKEPLADYFAKWMQRLDLFDSERPFYQVPEMPNERRHPIQALAIENASGNNATLFDHSHSSREEIIDPGKAVRWLIARQAFSVAGGNSKPFYFRDSPLVRGYTILVLGRNLFETLLLNMLNYNHQSPIPCIGNDAPTWEQDTPAKPHSSGTPTLGYLDYLTWQSRRIHLFPSRLGVAECQIMQNLYLAPQHMDPFKCYDSNPKRGIVPISLVPDKALWRDSHTLLQQAQPRYQRPKVFDWLAQIELARRHGCVDTSTFNRFSLIGFATEPTKPASVIMWRNERLPLPMEYLARPELVEQLGICLGLAENVQRDIQVTARYYAEQLFKANGQKNLGSKNKKTDIEAYARSLGIDRQYWPTLEPEFKRLLIDLPLDIELAQKSWEQAIGHSARKAFLMSINSLEPSASHLRAAALAERRLSYRLNKTLSPDMEVHSPEANQ